MPSQKDGVAGSLSSEWQQHALSRVLQSLLWSKKETHEPQCKRTFGARRAKGTLRSSDQRAGDSGNLGYPLPSRVTELRPLPSGLAL